MGDHDRDRAAMVRLLRHRGIADEDVLHAFGSVPREFFVDGPTPYADRAQPTSNGQTVSQQFVAALMTQAVRPAAGFAGARVLEVGTGSGYQAAVLARLGARVVSIERHERLGTRALANLRQAGLAAGVEVRIGDGSLGCPDDPPFDAILLTAAAPTVPQPLLDGLSADESRLVAPVGPARHHELIVVTRRDGKDTTTRLCSVVFVPLVGELGA